MRDADIDQWAFLDLDFKWSVNLWIVKFVSDSDPTVPKRISKSSLDLAERAHLLVIQLLKILAFSVKARPVKVINTFFPFE